jgi:regulator of cell morphogenesis and NO signaling
MQFTASTTVAELAAAEPATIKVFQRHKIDFCCGGKIPLADACARHALDTDGLLAELRAARAAAEDPADWRRLPLKDLVAHIQARYHAPLRDELPRLGAMLDKVVQRHGRRLPETLLPLQATFEELRRELLEHMAKEDAVVFPSVLALESHAAAEGTSTGWSWIEQPIEVLEAEHEAAGAALARMRALTGGYAPPEDACPTFRGLYYGLSELERDMHLHVHLENQILFPRAAQLASAGGDADGRRQ